MTRPTGNRPGRKYVGMYYHSGRNGWFHQPLKTACHIRLTRGGKEETRDEAKAALAHYEATGERPTFEPTYRGFHYIPKSNGFFHVDCRRKLKVRLTRGKNTPEAEAEAERMYAEYKATGVRPIVPRIPGMGGRPRLPPIPEGVNVADLTPDSDLIALVAVHQRRKLRGCNANTLKHYQIAIRQFGESLGRVPKIRDLTDDNVMDCVWWIVERGRSARTGNSLRKKLCCLWRLACRKGILREWPELENIPEPARTPIAWTRPQLEALFAELSRQTGTVCGIPANRWWTALHLFLWNTGERIGAVLQLRWENVDLAGGWVNVAAETRKGKKADKLFKLGADTIDAIRRIAKPERERVFPFDRDRSTLWLRYRKLLKRAGLPHGRKYKFHCVRKSVATHYEAAGGNATALLGHSSRAVTEAYLDPRLIPQLYAADVLFQPGAVAVKPRLRLEVQPQG